jgi:hypothetical protein
MAMRNKLTKEFLGALKEIDAILSEMLFKKYSFIEKGLAHFVQYKKGNTILEFLFGPSDWDVDMKIYTSKGKFAFKELLKIPSIAKWVNENRYKQENGRNIKNELLWFIELLKISLPMIE